MKKELAPATLKKYRNVIKGQFDASWKNKDIREITPEMIEAQFYEARKTARDRCYEMLKVLKNIWTTCAPLYKDGNGKRLLCTSPIPEARELLKNVRRDQPKRSIVPMNLLGKFMVLVEQIKTGVIPLREDRTRMATEWTERMCNLILLSLFTASRSLDRMEINVTAIFVTAVNTSFSMNRSLTLYEVLDFYRTGHVTAVTFLSTDVRSDFFRHMTRAVKGTS